MATETNVSQLVVIGASVGGIEALCTLVPTLPTDFPAPVVIAQHLDPDHPSHLADILASRSALPVRPVVDQTPLDAGVVFVVPANRHVAITEHALSLRADGGHPKPSVDLLLSSAAHVFGENLIAVILTGTGADGATGAWAVKQAGGTVVIQNPQTAQFPGMPQAIPPTLVDAVADLADIGPLLRLLLADPPVQGDDERLVQALLVQVRKRTGIALSSYKMPTLRRRIQRRMVATQTSHLHDYIAYLQAHPDEHARLIGSLLIRVTAFFWDPEVFDFLRDQVLPALISQARRQGNVLRLWSAGCATGEEAYSLAILLCEALGTERPRFSVRLFATDLDTEALTFARRGIYPRAALSALPAEWVARYFDEVDGSYQVSTTVRSLVIFGQHDLSQQAPFAHMDLVLCRNVLIYFTPELQKHVLALLACSLRDGGYLVLGKAETTTPLAEFFTPEPARHHVYRRHGQRCPRPVPLIPPPRPPSGRGSSAQARAGDQGPGQGGPAAPQVVPTPAEDVLLRLPVGLVLVDRHYDIQCINTAARRLLGIRGAALGEDIVHLVQGRLADALRAAIDAALRQEEATTLDEVPTEKAVPGETHYLQIACTAYPSGAEKGVPGSVLVVVTDTTRTALQRREQQEEIARHQEEIARLTTLVEQLSATNHEIQAANDDLAAITTTWRGANQELRFRVEEAHAASGEAETLNEELQATNEDLETLNEELQATIEEMTVTNAELQTRNNEIQDLATSLEEQHRRLNAILSSIGEAVVVVDQTGQVVFRSTMFAQLFGATGLAFTPEDADGRPLPPERMPQQRLARGEEFQMQCTLCDAQGERRWFDVTGRPICGDAPHHDGVLVIHDITDRSPAHRTLPTTTGPCGRESGAPSGDAWTTE